MADEGHCDDASPQEVWAILRELSASQRETDRRMQETDRLMRENARRIRELDELFNGQWGKLMEALVKGDLVALLNRRGIEVELVFTNVERNYGGRRWEIDILAVNGAELVAVEVKTTLKVRDVDHFLDAAALHRAGAGVRRPRRLWGGGLPEGGRVFPHVCGTTGTVRDSGDRQQREHHQRHGLPAARVWQPARARRCPVAGGSAPTARRSTTRRCARLADLPYLAVMDDRSGWRVRLGPVARVHDV